MTAVTTPQPEQDPSGALEVTHTGRIRCTTIGSHRVDIRFHEAEWHAHCIRCSPTNPRSYVLRAGGLYESPRTEPML